MIRFLTSLRFILLWRVISSIFESVVYIDVAVPYGQAGPQSMEFGHHWVMGKLSADKVDKFPQLFFGNLRFTYYRLIIKILYDIPPQISGGAIISMVGSP